MKGLRMSEKNSRPGKGRPKIPVDIDETLKLYRVGQMTVREVAGILGVSPNTVARRITEHNGQLRSWRLPGES